MIEPASPDDLVAKFWHHAGIRPAALPLVVATGIAVLCATQSSLVGRFADVVEDWLVTGWVFAQVARLSDWMAEVQSTAAVWEVGSALLTAVPVAVVAFLVAASVRSVREQVVGPVRLAAAGVGAGLLSLPLVAILAISILWIVGLVGAIANWVASVLATIAPVLGYLILACGAAVYLWLTYLGIKWLISNLPLVLRIVGWAIVGLLVVAAICLFLAQMTAVLAWLAEAARVIGLLFSAVVSWVIVAFGFLMAAFVTALGLTAVFGQAGQSLVLPLASSTSSGRDPAACINAAVAAGLGCSYLLLAGEANAAFGTFLDVRFAMAPVLGDVASVIGELYGFLMPDSVSEWVSPAFIGFQPLVEAGLVVGVSSLGALSLALGDKRWRSEADSAVLLPVVVFGVLAIVVMLIASVLFGTQE